MTANTMTMKGRSATMTVVEAPPTDPAEIDMYELRSAFVAADVWPDVIDAMPDRHPSQEAWENMRDEILNGLVPEFCRLFDEALAARLPWTWKPDR